MVFSQYICIALLSFCTFAEKINHIFSLSTLIDSFFVEKCFPICAEKISFYKAEAINNNQAFITFLLDFLRTIITINKQHF